MRDPAPCTLTCIAIPMVVFAPPTRATAYLPPDNRLPLAGNCADISIAPADGTSTAVPTDSSHTGDTTSIPSTAVTTAATTATTAAASTDYTTVAGTTNSIVTGHLSTDSAGVSEARRREFLDTLGTYEIVTHDGATETVIAIHSSGGAAGGVVTEGQGYGVLIGGIVTAATDPNQDLAHWRSVADDTYLTYKGWRQMTRLSATSGSCQAVMYCGVSCPHTGGSTGQGCYPCLPHWKLSDDLSSVIGTGSAADGDLDAITGMILLTLATQSRASEFTWWAELARTTYQTCKQIMADDTVAGAGSNEGKRILKLGSCWGGFGPEQCNNPSYHAPAAFRAMRDYMAAFDGIVGADNAEGDGYSEKWDALIVSCSDIASCLLGQQLEGCTGCFACHRRHSSHRRPCLVPCFHAGNNVRDAVGQPVPRVRPHHQLVQDRRPGREQRW